MRNRLVIAGITVLTAVIACASEGNAAYGSAPTASPVHAAPAPRGIVPTGTELVLRTEERVDTKETALGHVYPAEVARPILDSRNVTIVSEGTPAELIVVKSTSGGALGTPELRVAVRSLTINGKTYAVNAGIQEEKAEARGIGKNKRTAAFVGGGAAIGTLIGAIAGGGAGAAVGALTGAAGGGALQLMTKGKRVAVPAESLLTFRLEQPVQLR